MKQEERELFLKDLSARLPYGVKLYNAINGFTVPLSEFSSNPKVCPLKLFEKLINDGWLPYLRPMSSMTEEEKKEYDLTMDLGYATAYNQEIFCATSMIDFFNKHHLDYRGLIEKGLALAAPVGMYN